MKVKIQKWEDQRRIVFTRKYKNTKRPNIYLREKATLRIEIKNNKRLYFWNDTIEIEEYNDSIRQWIWQQIERGK
jgi:hypothetical protein